MNWMKFSVSGVMAVLLMFAETVDAQQTKPKYGVTRPATANLAPRFADPAYLLNSNDVPENEVPAKQTSGPVFNEPAPQANSDLKDVVQQDVASPALEEPALDLIPQEQTPVVVEPVLQDESPVDALNPPLETPSQTPVAGPRNISLTKDANLAGPTPESIAENLTKPAPTVKKNARTINSPMTIPKNNSDSATRDGGMIETPPSGYLQGMATANMQMPDVARYRSPCANSLINQLRYGVSDVPPASCDPGASCGLCEPPSSQTFAQQRCENGPVVPTVRPFTSAMENVLENQEYAPECVAETNTPSYSATTLGPPMAARRNAAAWAMQSPDGTVVYAVEDSVVIDPEQSRCSRVMSGLIAAAEFLGWQTERGENVYASYMSNTGDVYDERALSPSGAGMRVKLGYRALSGWDFIGTYAYFDGDKSGALVADQRDDLTLTSPRSVDSVFPLDRVDATAKTALNVYDFEFGRWSWNATRGWRPFVGFRWTNLRETNVENMFAGSSVETSMAKSTLNAYGLRLGLEWKRDLFAGLQAYAKGAGVVAVGDLESTLYRDGTCARKMKRTEATPSVEAGLGVAWRRGEFEVRAGYEFNDWFNASNLNGTTNDFIAHGWTVGLAWNR